MDPARTLLVRAPNWLGDCVMCLPALDALRAALPEAQLDVACEPSVIACFEAHPGVRRVVRCPTRRGWGRLAALWQNARQARTHGYDLGVLFTNSFSSALWLWWTGTPRRLGYRRDGRGLLLTDAVAVTPALAAAHMTDYYRQLLKGVGAACEPAVPAPGAAVEPVIPTLTAPTAGMEAAAQLRKRLGVTGRYALLAPVSAYGPVKDWPAARYVRIASRLAADWDMHVLITGTEAQKQACEDLAREAGARVSSAAGETDLAGFLGLVAGASVFLGGDSGGAHAAAALGVPTVVLFGITEPSRTRQLGRAVRLLGQGGESTPDLDAPETRARARAALEAIHVDAVWEALEGLRPALEVREASA